MHPNETIKAASALEASTTATAAAAAAAPSATVATPAAVSSAAAESAVKSTTPAGEPWANSGTSLHMPETMDWRDRLFAGISEESSDERGDDEAEVVIEPDGRIKVHPRRRPNYLRYGGALEPPAFGADLRADRGEIKQDGRAAEDLLLLQLLRNQRQGRGGHASGLDSLLEDEMRKLLVAEAIAGVSPHAFAELKTGSRSEADPPSGADSYGGSRVLTTPTGYFVAFIVGFGGILLIAMLCCVIRAAYVKRQKARLKKLLAEKLHAQSVEEPEHPGLTEPAFYEVVESHPSATTSSEDPTADPDWIDVRVEQQAPPEEQQMMNVVRMDTLNKAGLSAESTEEKEPQQLPYKSKKKQKRSADAGTWGDREKSRAGLKSRKKSGKASDVEDANAERGEEKRRKTTRRGKELKKALSSRRTVRLAT